jgi:phosphatidate cytidylyltransferase
MRDLRQRALSAAVLLALAVAGLFSGREAFELMVAVCGAVLAWEWTRLVGDGRFGATGLLVAAGVLASGAAAALTRADIGLGLALVAALLVLAFARVSGRDHCRWLAVGPLYIGIPVVALIWLRGDAQGGLVAILWLMASVWATDTGAYFAGRLIGGAKLAPRLSPNKTWAGLVGAMVAAACVGWAAALMVPQGPSATVLAGAGAGLAVVAQAGDLLESWIKRHFGAKDSSGLIPGHGGLFDRVDGLLTAACALAAFQWSTRGLMLAWP